MTTVVKCFVLFCFVIFSLAFLDIAFVSFYPGFFTVGDGMGDHGAVRYIEVSRRR